MAFLYPYAQKRFRAFSTRNLLHQGKILNRRDIRFTIRNELTPQYLIYVTPCPDLPAHL